MKSYQIACLSFAPAVVWFLGMVISLSMPVLHSGQLVSVPGLVDSAEVNESYNNLFGPPTVWLHYNLNGERRFDHFSRLEVRVRK